MVSQLKSAHEQVNSLKSPSSPHLLNGTTNYHQNVNKNTFEANKNSCETNKNIPEPENQQRQTRNKKETFVGNLNNDLNIKDLRSYCLQTMSIMNCLTHLFPMHPFSDIFRGVEKVCIGNK